MSGNTHTSRVHNEALKISAQNAFVRQLIAEAAEQLRAPAPDTFLGRKTQEPFPRENE